MRNLIIPFFLILSMLQSCSPHIIGVVEKAQVLPSNLIFSAKLDTGADHSSINADKIKRIQRDGKQWVRFRIKNALGQSAILERPLLRMANIKRHSGSAERRPVIELKFCLHQTCQIVETNLANRSNFNHPLLIGRSAMKNEFIIDPSKQNTHSPNCQSSCR